MKARWKNFFSHSKTNPLSTCSLMAMALVVAGICTPGFAQSAPDTLQAICESAPDDSGVSMIQAWIDARIGDIINADEDSKKLQDVRNAFRKETTRTKADPVFLNRFAEEIGAKFTERFKDCGTADPALVRTMAYILGDINNIGAIDGLNAGLSCREREDVRYLCAKGFLVLQPKIAPDRVLAERVIGQLADAAKQEPNGVIARTLFSAMAFEDKDLKDATTKAMIDALTGRVEIIKQRKGKNGGGNLTALAFLQANLPTEQAEKVRLASQLAVMLRLDTERLLEDKAKYAERNNLARDIDAAESLLVSLVRPQQAPNMRGALKKPADERIAELQLELNGWIGTDQTPGALNGDPWNVPVGAP